MAYSKETQRLLLRIQQSEMTEAAAYHAMASSIKDGHNRETLGKIADEIAAQAHALEKFTDALPQPDNRKVRRYARMARVFGFTFAAKLMDKRKVKVEHHAKKLLDEVPEVERLEADEHDRDEKLFDLLSEKRLSYVGAMILGMNDAIVEITGTLAGLTLAMQNTRLIALSGLITGVAATLSMAASEYLAERSDGKGDAAKSGLMTGGAYFITVVILLLPYLILDDKMYLLAMGIMLAFVILILAAFNFYTSVARDVPFGKNFGQMCAISLGVAALSFVLDTLFARFLASTSNLKGLRIMQMTEEQFNIIKAQLKKLVAIPDGFYAKKFAGIDIDAIKDQSDFEKLPFTDKGDLREAYPLGIAAVPTDQIVRIHSSSGTTGTPVIIPYTKKDVADWAIQFARCYEYAGVTKEDRVHITPGYGLWTAGIGFQAGCELLGAMAIPMGPGNTDKQLKMMMDLESTVLCATSSYALRLAEEIAKRGIGDQIRLRKGIIGSERWGEKMRRRIANELGVELYDIYGLTEIYGPGIGINCQADSAVHIWSDYMYLEIIDPVTGQPVPDGEPGEIVLTTLQKEGAPLIRFRTHDLSRIVPGECACGHNEHPRIDIITGRTDDMVKVHGVNMFPAQIEEVIAAVKGASSEYQMMIDHLNGKDIATLFVEVEPDANKYNMEETIATEFRNRIGFTPQVKPVDIEDLPRSEKKTTRIFDNRY